MRTIKPRTNQTLFDAALQNFGSVEAAFKLGFLNDKALTDKVSGLSLITDQDVESQLVYALYTRENVSPATDEYIEPQAEEGIGYWLIGDEFIIQ